MSFIKRSNIQCPFLECPLLMVLLYALYPVYNRPVKHCINLCVPLNVFCIINEKALYSNHTYRLMWSDPFVKAYRWIAWVNCILRIGLIGDQWKLVLVCTTSITHLVQGCSSYPTVTYDSYLTTYFPRILW